MEHPSAAMPANPMQDVVKDVILASSHLEYAMGRMKIIPLAVNTVEYKEIERLQKKVQDAARAIAQLKARI